jgi:hypothetical protein
MAWDEKRRGDFDAAVAKLQAVKAKFEAIAAGVSNQCPEWIKDRLKEATVEYQQARTEFEKTCAHIDLKRI